MKKAVSPGTEDRYGSFKPTDEVFAAWKKTEDIAHILNARVIVFQCPPSFGPTPEHKQNIIKFFSSINRGTFLLAWEPRGEWQTADIRTMCEEMDLVHVVDPFKTQATYGSIRYYRLHGLGGYRYRYSASDLNKLKELIRGGKTEMESYVLFNNVYMYEDARTFKQLLEPS
jgi:uncharacterized protein YecE (DUF72 family)